MSAFALTADIGCFFPKAKIVLNWLLAIWRIFIDGPPRVAEVRQG